MELVYHDSGRCRAASDGHQGIHRDSEAVVHAAGDPSFIAQPRGFKGLKSRLRLGQARWREGLVITELDANTAAGKDEHIPRSTVAEPRHRSDECLVRVRLEVIAHFHAQAPTVA